MLIGAARFLTRAHAARGSFGDKDAVGRRQFGGLQAIEDELGLDHLLAHRRGCSMRPRQELLQRLRDHGGQRPPRRGGMRTDPRDERHRQLDGEHRGRGGHRNMSGPAGALHVAVRLPGRTAEPAGQLSRGVGCRHPRVQQVRGGVDPLGEHVTTSATGRPTNRHH